MEIQIRLISILALFIRKAKIIILCALLGGILFGAFSLFIKNDNELDSNTLRDNYEESIRVFEMQSEKIQEQITNQRDYINTSLLMKLNPYQVHKTNVRFSITIDDADAMNQVFGQEITPMDYLSSKVGSQYAAIWNQSDLAEALDISDSTDRYLREVASMSYEAASNSLLISTMGTTEEDSAALADAVCRFLQKEAVRISDNSCRHILHMLSKTSKTVIDGSIAEKQVNAYLKLEELKAAWEDMERDKKTNSVLSPKSEFYSVIKKSILGIFAGALLACLWVMAQVLLRGIVIDPLSIVETPPLPLLGILPRKKKALERWSDKLNGVPTWIDPEKAFAYGKEKTSLYLSERKKVLLASTLSLEQWDIENAAKLLKAPEQQIIAADDFFHSPFALAGLKECDSVVLAEKNGFSKYPAIQELITISRAAGKPVDGYILL